MKARALGLSDFATCDLLAPYSDSERRVSFPEAQKLVLESFAQVAPPFAEAEFDIRYNHGVNKEGSILDIGIEQGVVDKKGAWLQFNGELIGQGKEAARLALVEKPELGMKIIEAIMAKRAAGPALTA